MIGDDGPVPILPLHRSISEQRAKQPDHPAIIVAGGEEVLTYGVLADRVAAAASGLEQAGVHPGDRVAIASEKPAEHLIAAVATMAVGGIPVPLPLSHPESRSDVLADASPTLVVAPDGQSAGPGDAILGALEDAGAGNPDWLDRAAAPEDHAMIYYTSGTTSGIRKGVLQNHHALEATARYISHLTRISDGIVEFVCSPTDNAFWFGRCRVVLRAGGTLVLNQGSFSPARIVRVLDRYRCTAISGDTPIFMLLLKLPEGALSAVGPRLRWVKIASQAMDPDAKRRILALMPKARVVMNYGLTEAMRCCILALRDHPDKLASVGRPCPGVQVRVVDDAGEPMAALGTGEIQVRGDNLASGYLNKDELWRARFRDGWYATGDLGFLDEDGFLRIKGRKDEAINVGGRTVSPMEVEACLKPFLRHTTFYVCGAKDPNAILGDVPVLCVAGQWNEPVPWRETVTALQGRVPRSFVPRGAVLVPEVPRTANGKLCRGILQERVGANVYKPL